ncbi:hypothetical protein ABZ829_29390 [Streptomyces xanthochromogenes]|uniref:hypothetical protein n=1 Tax=Streptomyces xanthochromogenes TaxID=67384 RepID=UPI0034198CF5
MSTVDVREITAWLAGPVPEAVPALREWERSPAAVPVIALGARFEAVRIADAVVHAAVSSTAHATLAWFLAEYLQGAVIRDSGLYYALVPTRTARDWQALASRCLGRGAGLAIPHPTCRRGPRTHWVVPPERVGDVCDPVRVADLVRVGQERLLARPAPRRWPAPHAPAVLDGGAAT